MSTTALFVEYLVVGGQSVVWIGLALCCFFGTGWISGCADIADKWGVMIALLGSGILYTSGIVIERLSGAIAPLAFSIRLLDKVLWLRRFRSLARDRRTELIRQQGRVTESLEYGLSRIRVVRAGMANLVLTYAAAIIAISRSTIPATSIAHSIGLLSIVFVLMLAGLCAGLVILLISHAAALDDASA